MTDPGAALALLPLVGDTDGDTLPDAVQARIVLGVDAGLPEVLAGMHLAARLTFETLALRGPIAAQQETAALHGGVRLFVGRLETLHSACPATLAALLGDLPCGEGVIAVDRQEHALLVGGDEAGLQAATMAFCRGWNLRLPARESDDRIVSLRIPAGQGDLSAQALEDSAAHVPAPRSLAGLYGPEGLICDTDGDLLPDRLRTCVSLPPDLAREEIEAAMEFAARLGLETLGLHFPFVFAAHDAVPEAGDTLVAIAPLAATRHPQPAGSGALRLVTLPSGAQRLQVEGTDTRGRLAAIRALAQLDCWEGGQPALERTERALARLCALADPAAALCAAIAALPAAVHSHGSEVRHMPCPAGLEEHAAALSATLNGWLAARYPEARPSVQLDTASAAPLFEARQQFGWEVDDAWMILRDQVLPALQRLPGDAWQIDIRLSEPAGRRARIKHELLALIRAAGRQASEQQVRVLPAYKQGQAWLLEEVLPLLLLLRPHRLHLGVQRFAADEPSLELPIRWVQDLFPVDEQLAAALGLPLEAITLEVRDQHHTYILEAYDGDGAILLQRAFDVTTTTRHYLRRFPAWGTVHPSTGGVRLLHGELPLVDVPVATDPERAWEYLQGTVLPRLEEVVRAVCDGEPRIDRQPFFGDLTVDLWLSEEDAASGVREERCSTLESLHEDIYFTVLDFCTALLGESTGYRPPWVDPDQPRRGARAWTAPGRVIPSIHRREGAAGRMAVRLLPARAVYPTLSTIDTAPVTPRVTAYLLEAQDREPPPTLVVTLEGPEEQQRGARAMLEVWGALRGRVPGWDSAIPAAYGLRIEAQGCAALSIPAAPTGEEVTAPAAEAPQRLDAPVPWDRILGIAEIEQQIAALRGAPCVKSYLAGRSAQGRPAYAIELTVPRGTGQWSRAHLSAWKTTLLLNARHHANEPSSTNALLEVARRLAVDPAWHHYLHRVNVVILPGENPDGMALYQELVDEHPTWMHHAARYNAAGLEYAAEYTRPFTRHTEALVLPAVWRRWAPDITCDDHGFPAHEWLQLFAGQGNPWFRDYWIAQGLIFAYLPTIRSARYTSHWEAMRGLRERMISALAADGEVAVWNGAHADRYRAYLHRWAPERFPAPYDRDVLMHVREYDPDLPPSRAGSLASLPGRFPGVTTASITTEVADESAQGGYMALCARAHLILDRVLLQYLYDADAPAAVERRQATRHDGCLVLSATRRRPVVLQMDEHLQG